MNTQLQLERDAGGGRGDVLARIRRWKKNGELGRHQSELFRALAELDGVEARERAGYALRDVTAEALGHGAPLLQLKIAIASNFSVNGLDHLLRSRLLAHGIYPSIYASGYDEYVRELLEPGSELYRHDPKLALCVLDEHVVYDAVAEPWRVDRVESVLEEKLSLIERLIAAFAERSSGTLVLNTVVLSARSLARVLDYKSKARLARAFQRFNTRLFELAESGSRLVVLDTQVLLQSAGVGLCDARLAFHGAMYMGSELCDALAGEVVKVARAILGRSKKCLMLDLDDTLWGGVLGDVGVAGLELGDSARGKAFLELQKIALGFKEQGVLLAVNSKNDRKNVDQALAENPAMVLGAQDFVAISANWEPKHENTRNIARALNLDPDAFVFLDDSPFERHLVETVPGVTVLELPEDAVEYPDLLLAGGWFDVLSLTSEDKSRTELYQHDAQREELKASAQSFDDYLRALEIEVDVAPPDELRLPRFVQLGQRTNQFNLTGRRYQAGELEVMSKGDTHLVLAVEGRDRFGEYGLVGGVVVEKFEEGERAWWLRNFLLSCRVFSREIEGAVLGRVLEQAKLEGARAVYGEYVPSAKNSRFENFYASRGFERVDVGAATHVYRRDLEQLPAPIPWIKLGFSKEART